MNAKQEIEVRASNERWLEILRQLVKDNKHRLVDPMEHFDRKGQIIVAWLDYFCFSGWTTMNQALLASSLEIWIRVSIPEFFDLRGKMNAYYQQLHHMMGQAIGLTELWDALTEQEQNYFRRLSLIDFEIMDRSSQKYEIMRMEAWLEKNSNLKPKCPAEVHAYFFV